MQSHWNFIFLYVSTFLKIKCWRRTHLVTVGKRSCFHLKYMTLLAQRRLQNVPMVAKMTGYNRKLTSPNEKVSTVWQWYDQIVEMLIWYMWNLQIYRICGLQKGPLPVSHLIWSSLNWCLSVKKKGRFLLIKCKCTVRLLWDNMAGGEINSCMLDCVFPLHIESRWQNDLLCSRSEQRCMTLSVLLSRLCCRPRGRREEKEGRLVVCSSCN